MLGQQSCGSSSMTTQIQSSCRSAIPLLADRAAGGVLHAGGQRRAVRGGDAAAAAALLGPCRQRDYGLRGGHRLWVSRPRPPAALGACLKRPWSHRVAPIAPVACNANCSSPGWDPASLPCSCTYSTHSTIPRSIMQPHLPGRRRRQPVRAAVLHGGGLAQQALLQGAGAAGRCRA